MCFDLLEFPFWILELQAHTVLNFAQHPSQGLCYLQSPLLVFLCFCVFESPDPVVFCLYSAATADAGHSLFRPFTRLLRTGLGFHWVILGAFCFIHCFQFTLGPQEYELYHLMTLSFHLLVSDSWACFCQTHFLCNRSYCLSFLVSQSLHGSRHPA